MAAAILFVSLRIYERVEPEMKTGEHIKKIAKFGTLDIEKVKASAKSVLHLTKEFEKRFPKALNLKNQYKKKLAGLTH